MTWLLEMAVEAARQLSPEEQDELARTIVEIVGGAGDGVHALSDEQRAAINVGLAETDRGEFALDEEVAALFSKYPL